MYIGVSIGICRCIRLTCIAWCDIAQAMAEKAAQVGDDTLRRVGTAANREATQFGEQGGRFSAAPAGSTSGAAAAVGLVGRHVRCVQKNGVVSKATISLPLTLYLSLACSLVRSRCGRVM